MFSKTKHINVSELENILDPDAYNLTFKDVATLKKRCADWVAAPHRDAIINLNAPDSRLIDTVHAIRNFIAHQSPNVKAIMDQRLVSVADGAACPNFNLSRGAHDIHDIGAFLKSTVAGSRRVKLFISCFFAIAVEL